MFPVEYAAKIFDEIDEVEKTVYGVTFGETIGEAACNIDEYYKNTLVSLELYPLEDSSVYEFNCENITVPTNKF